jgi:hypothetical protein
MLKYSLPDSLLDVLRQKLPFSWYVFTGLVALFLAITLVLTAYLDGGRSLPSNWNYWRAGLIYPLILIYIMVIYPFVQRLSDQAVQSIIPFLKIEKDSLGIFGKEHSLGKHRGEWVALAVGILFIISLTQPWQGIRLWMDLYALFTGIIMFGVLAWLIYLGISNTRYLTRLSQKMDLDIFNIEALIPVARWSLSESGAFIGGIVISIALQSPENILHWQVLVIYLILVGSTIAIFFMSLWGTHVKIHHVKQAELDYAVENLTAASRKLKQPAGEDPSNFYYAVAAWGIYERKIREIREWPYNTGIIGRLILSAIAPGAVYLIKVLTGTRMGF